MKSKSKIAGLVVLLFLFACKKDKQEIVYANCNSQTHEAIINYVDPAGDGCGWTVTVLKNPAPAPQEAMAIYSPVNLGSQYKQENLHVRITYRIEGDGYYCGIASTRMETITIVNIVIL